MFRDVGEKIKRLAQILFWFEAVLSVIGGIVLIALSSYLYALSGYGAGTIVGGVVLLVFGPLVSWCASFFLYGFGQLIDNTDRLVALQSGSGATSRKKGSDTLKAPEEPVFSAEPAPMPESSPECEASEENRD